ncbi:hypothetical protein PCASD_11110 [Puccinia coronata f. sp. avenae]|uniref:Uncharacterized protein n=1 Tax=Puccinia coronata f. sp. avenae TaxID=200324 RepID=A0A2N5TB54_9BASI|nr:hypothetical protein PCASD_11110 [Puccinia coronata f. sp. avenae]
MAPHCIALNNSMAAWAAIALTNSMDAWAAVVLNNSMDAWAAVVLNNSMDAWAAVVLNNSMAAWRSMSCPGSDKPSAKAAQVAIRKAARQPNGFCDGHHQPNGPSDGHRNDPMAVRADGPSEQPLGCSTARCARWPLRAAIGWHNPMAA